jgi:hypothetical protein
VVHNLVRRVPLTTAPEVRLVKWWQHPGLWMAVGALAYPAGTAAGWAVIRWYTGADRGHAFGARVR